MALPQDFVQHVAQFPGDDPVVHSGQTEGDGPEGLSTLLLEGADDGGPNMFLLHGGLSTVYRLINGNRLKGYTHTRVIYFCDHLMFFYLKQKLGDTMAPSEEKWSLTF